MSERLELPAIKSDFNELLFVCTDVLRHSHNTLRVCVAASLSTLFSHFSPHHPSWLFIYSFGRIELILISKDQCRRKEKEQKIAEEKEKTHQIQIMKSSVSLGRKNTDSKTTSMTQQTRTIRNKKL